jgi:hypothetical protein
MREFDSLVFMGAGDRSAADCYRLHRMLDRALGNLSALQQAGQHYSEERRAGMECGIEDAVKDIAAALLGKKIKIGEKLPYPGKLKRQS